MEQSAGKLHNQVAIVTGAAQGMGAAIAGRLAVNQGRREGCLERHQCGKGCGGR